MPAKARTLRVAVGQMDCIVGDVPRNLAVVERLARQAAAQDCELIVFPELALTGYAVGPGFAAASLTPDSPEVLALRDVSREIAMAVGFIEETEDTEFFNSALYLEGGEIRHVHRKVYLPNYRIFDERRYFGTGRGVWGFDTPWGRMAMLICGDAWHLPMPYLAAHDGADVLLVMAASSTEGLTPDVCVRSAWQRMNQTYALMLSNFVLFANRAGSETPPDSNRRLSFWGGSHVCDPSGAILAQAAEDVEDLLVADLDLTQLRRQRLILPFRRDDSLSFALGVGRKVARAKARRRNGLFGQVSTHGRSLRPPQPGPAPEPPPPPPMLEP